MLCYAPFPLKKQIISNKIRTQLTSLQWITNPGLGKHLAVLGKGLRHCLGMHLAYAEMYILVAAIFRRFGSREVCFESG
jgi:hypothetical protein